MGKIRVLIVNDKLDSLNIIENLLQQFKEIKVIGKLSSGKEAVDSILELDPDIILMDTNMPGIDGFTAAKTIHYRFPYIGIILLGTTESSYIMRKAMQSGAADYLVFPLNSEKVYNAILELYNAKSCQRKNLEKNLLKIPKRHCQVIPVFSSKGGVGKSVLAVNSAIALKQLTKKEVLLIDLDLQFGDIAYMLSVDSRVNIVDMISDKKNLDSDDIEKYIITHKSGIKVLTAPSHPEQADLVEMKDVKDIIELFQKMFQYIVIDMTPFLNEIILRTIEMADNLLLITTMEVPTLKDVKTSLDILYTIGYPKEKITLVLNRYNKYSEMEVKDIKKFIGIEDIMYVNDCSEIVSKSINMGEPFVIANKNSEITKQIFQICSQILGNNYKDSLVKGLKNSENNKNKFLSKIFKIK